MDGLIARCIGSVLAAVIESNKSSVSSEVKGESLKESMDNGQVNKMVQRKAHTSNLEEISKSDMESKSLGVHAVKFMSEIF